jgi:predicted ester cyclase
MRRLDELFTRGGHMSEENKALARRWFEEVWNQGREETIDEMFHPEGKAEGFPTPEAIIAGAEQFKEIYRQFRKTFSGIHVEIEDLISEDDKVAIRWFASMRHTGEGITVAPTKEAVSLPGATFFRCKHGKIVAGWNLMDFTKIRLLLQDSEANKTD